MSYMMQDFTRALAPSYEQEAEQIAQRELAIMREREARFAAQDQARLANRSISASERAEIERRVAWRNDPATLRGQQERTMECARASLFRNT